MSKTHITNVVRISLGEMKKKKQRRRRRATTTKSTNKGLSYNNLLQDLQRLTSLTHNVANPNNSNSSTLMTKVNQLENEKKIKEIEHRIDTLPTTSTPPPTLPHNPSFMNSLSELEGYLTLRDYALQRPMRNTSGLADTAEQIRNRPKSPHDIPTVQEIITTEEPSWAKAIKTPPLEAKPIKTPPPSQPKPPTPIRSGGGGGGAEPRSNPPRPPPPLLIGVGGFG